MSTANNNPGLRRLCLLAGLLAFQAAHAEKADKDKPVVLDADRITVDDARKLHVLEGNVQLVRGTLVIQTAKLVVSQDNDGFQKAVASGGVNGLARFRQKREGRDEYVEGEADRIEHDGRIEKTELFGRAHIKSGLDEVSGHYISYDGRTENYLVTSGAAGAAGQGKPERVRAVIQPKNAEAKAGGAPALKPATEIDKPRPE